MSAIPNPQKWTIDAYFALEADSAIRHEYLDSDLVAMVSATEDHNLIIGNVLASLHGQLRGTDCRVFANDMRVKVSESAYTYPDVVVACADRCFTDRWLLTVFTTGNLALEAIQCTLEMDAVYEDVDFPRVYFNILASSEIGHGTPWRVPTK